MDEELEVRSPYTEEQLWKKLPGLGVRFSSTAIFFNILQFFKEPLGWYHGGALCCPVYSVYSHIPPPLPPSTIPFWETFWGIFF